jgi:hypothetical protein
MRVRIVASALLVALLAGLAIVFNPGSPVDAKLQDAATPATAAATPEATTTEAPKVVTLIAWYSQDPSGDKLNLGPLRTNNSLVASEETANDRALTGDVDFADPGNDGLPRITLGDSAFNAYPVNPDDPESVFRWTYTDDDSSLRPATLVLQINAVKGPYKGYSGTATFISRAAKAGGVLVIVLNPPSS